MTSAALDRAKDLIDALRAYRMAQITEAKLQAAIAEVLTREGFAFTREERLGPGARPDFWVEPGVCVEVKIKGSASNVRRQLARYCAHERTMVLLLVTTRSDYQMPSMMEDKPVLTVCVGGAFL
jgi:hypothetical protein